MVSLSSTLVLAGLFAAQPGVKKIAVFDLVSTGVKSSVAQSANAMLQGLIQQSVHDAEVVSPGEALSCPSAVCLAQMGKGMGAKEVVSGHLSGLGRTYMLELRRIDVGSEKMIRSAVRTAKGEEDALVDAMRDAVAELLGGVGEPLTAQGREEAKHAEPVPQAKPPAETSPPRTGATIGTCTLAYTAGKWLLCIAPGEVAWIWSSQEGAPGAKFVATDKRDWFMRNAGKTWRVRVDSCIHENNSFCETVDVDPSQEPWNPPAAELVRAVARVPSRGEEKFSMAGFSFEVGEEKIRMLLPDAEDLTFGSQAARITINVGGRMRELP
jgi:hypothetical protein